MDEQQSSHLNQVPSSASSESTGRDETPDRRKTGGRKGLTRNACNRCRQKKSKCDGKRDTCSRCEKDNAECIYDIPEEGMTRMQNVQQQLESKTNEYTKMTTLFDALQHESDFNASALLAQLRLGANVDDLLSSLGALRAPEMDGRLSLLNPHGPSREQLQSIPGFARGWPSSLMEEGYWTPQATCCEPHPT